MKVLSAMNELDLSMSNCDHSIDDGLAESLKEDGNNLATYYAWDFCGYVWWDSEKQQFICQVWRYNVPQEEIAADTLENLMDIVSVKYGEE